MGLFGKKDKKEDEDVKAAPPPEEELAEKPSGEGLSASDSSGSVGSIGQISADIEKLKAQFSSFYEMQKASNERFTRISEQIGEIREMVLDRDKRSQMLEAKATQAIDMVSSIQPDKLMIEVRKQDSKIEALKANIEANENILHNSINELKDIRNKMSTFRGVDQVVKLSDEVKKELLSVRQVQSTIERHADKVETIFTEVQKSSQDFSKFNDVVKDLDKSFKEVSIDFDAIKVRSTGFATKKELDGLVSKFEDFEKHASNVVSLMNKKFDKLEKDFTLMFNTRLEKAETLLTGFRTLAQKTPDLDKYFNLLTEEAKKAEKKDIAVEKIKEPGQEEKEETPVEEKKGLFDKLT